MNIPLFKMTNNNIDNNIDNNIAVVEECYTAIFLVIHRKYGKNCIGGSTQGL